jgi:uncharacterized YigZ family protein
MNAMPGYSIPKARVRIEIRVSNSRFIATAGPVFSTKEAQEFIRGIRQEMPDATHHVYAFKIGFGASIREGLSDDGEPSGTSGPPVMAVLRGADIGDAVIVITRYFGGTKLGTGGLVAAYTQAAQAVMAEMQTELKIDRTAYSVKVPYAMHESIRRSIHAHDGEISDESYTDEVRINFIVPTERAGGLLAAIRDLSAGTVNPKNDQM